MSREKKIDIKKELMRVEQYCKAANIKPSDLIECHKWLRYINKLPQVKNLPSA